KRRRPRTRLRSTRRATRGVPRRRTHYGDQHYRQVAEVALGHQQRGHAPLRDTLAKEFNCKPETVRDWLRRARELGWLATTGPGRRGVEPGPRLRDALREGTR